MNSKELKNKPLVEAILEITWALEEQGPGVAIDPHYPFLLGRFSERVAATYKSYEELPTAMVPVGLVGHMVQHRFRTAPNAWPLVQLGPGILTVNDTVGYAWDDFKPRCQESLKALVDAHPRVSDLQFEGLTLRYIDAVDFDWAQGDVLGFLKDQLKTTLALPATLFEGGLVMAQPSKLNWQVSFPLSNPAGNVTLRFATGQRGGNPAFLWETIVSSTRAELPGMPEEFAQWLEAAHSVTHDWFFKLIAGELERRFSSE